MKCMWLFAAMAFAVSPRIAGAQKQNDLISLRYALLAHADGTSLRIRTDDGALHGTISFRIVGPTLVVNDTVMPPMVSVTHVWRRHNQAARGAMIGGVSGALLVGWAGALFGSMGCGAPPCRKEQFEGALIGIAAGGLSGSLLGSAIGVGIPGWKLVWQRGPQ